MNAHLLCRRVIGVGAALIAMAWLARELTPFAAAQTPEAVPVFKVDPAWPRPLPNKWAVGPVSGITTDARDHIWIIHRGEAVTQAGGVPAPPVIEFDQAGNVVQTWGGPGTGYDWPQQVHGITIDGQDRVWISGNGDRDSHILVFTRQGKFLRQIGRAGASGDSNDTANLGRATQMRVDLQSHEVYVSDGEQNQHHRVIVFDSENGRYKRHWGAYGEKPDDAAAKAPVDPAGPPPRQFGNAVHCLRIDRDGLVYVCDRSNGRFQIFRKDGMFQKEIFLARESAVAAAVGDIDFSPGDQKFLYVADSGHQKVWILRRDQLQVVGSFGERGPGPGQFATTLHDLTVDSKGNVYTGEAASAGRVQKFTRR
jgi:sugar lactone lactonase YvrE